MEESIENGPQLAPFLTKCYEMVDDPATDTIISWSLTSDSFIIWDVTELSQNLLPKYFKHSNFSSFMRQLNTYGFRKSDPDRWEFANDRFVKGQKHLLKNVSRRKQSQGLVQQKQSQRKKMPGGACVEVGKFGLWEEVESLKRDKNVVMQELVKLRQYQETADNKLVCLSQRLQGMEKNQQQLLSFLVMAMQSPGFLAQLLQPKENNWCMAKPGMKRQLPMLEQGTEGNETVVSDGQIVRYQPLMKETPKPLLVPITNSDMSPEVDPSPNGVNDFFVDIDFMSLPMEEDLLSSENDGPIIFPDFSDDGILEQLLLDSPSIENVDGTETETQEPMVTWIEMESREHGTQPEKSQNLELLTEQMGLLASETNSHETLKMNFRALPMA
ncbi:hypothetical protein HHK36_024464 [Tetracentron sinense]|uniref:HSF-type DNA-binding domain-containing protein n=1 Tax=Tetracentron sinense TaxID=13715 RepID=A0A835D7I3_TETSI|nr:hypothetical protein HHK36_024464 [Tetracentron sinense]